MSYIENILKVFKENTHILFEDDIFVPEDCSYNEGLQITGKYFNFEKYRNEFAIFKVKDVCINYDTDE